MTTRSEALFVGGRSGVGKSSVGFEIHAQLAAAGLRHCLIEGDNLDMAHPPPWSTVSRNRTSLRCGPTTARLVTGG
jgi:adenylylsulfate kinase-like enzyme